MTVNTSEAHWWSDRFSLLSEQRRFGIAEELQGNGSIDQPLGATMSGDPQALVGALYGELLCTTKSPTIKPVQDQVNLPTPPEAPLNILSAEVYNERPGVEDSRRRALRQDSDEACGYLVPPASANGDAAAEGHLMSPTSSMSQSQTVTRAASSPRTNSPPNKKPRGRPRVETQNETAVDRRRTQIRLAQRAYRLRKESTITSLRERITVLEDTIDNMTKAFLQLHDHAMDCGVIESCPGWGQKLKETTELFISLARKSRDDSEGHVDGEEKGTPDDNWEDVEAVDGSVAMTGHGSHGTASTAKAADHGSRKRKRVAHKSSSRTNGQASTPGPLNAPNDTGYAIPDRQDAEQQAPTLDQIIQTKPYTFSVQETTFARRLQRRSWERGYQFLLNPDISDASKAHIFFRLDFCQKTKEELISSLRQLLTRTTDESLDCIPGFTDRVASGIKRPYLKGSNSELFRNADSWWVRSTVDRGITSPDDTSSGPSAEHTTVDVSPYEGEWFDPADVENYLRKKGVHFAGQASYAEVELTDESYLSQIQDSADAPSDLTDANSSGRQQSSNLGPSVPSGLHHAGNGTPSDPINVNTINDSSSGQPFNPNAWSDDFAVSAQVDAFFGFQFDYLGGPSNSAIQNQQQARRMNEKRTRTMTLDVSRLLDEISKCGVCLGGAPGFRRHAIDSAMRVALQVS